MTRSIGAAIMVAALISGATAIHPAAAAPLQKPEISKATDLSARRHTRHYAERTDDRFYYYDRPTTYRPYPYLSPVPFFLGFGFGP